MASVRSVVVLKTQYDICIVKKSYYFLLTSALYSSLWPDK